MPILFVYGTLRKNEQNHTLLGDAKEINKQCWVEGSLYDTGNGYPVLVQGGDTNVYGELYEVTQNQLELIDELEGYKKNDTNNLFERVHVDVVNDIGHCMKAITYVGGTSLINSKKWIETGDWNVHKYLNELELLYFAYGSCMDDERFVLQKVDHHFKDVLGCGSLDGYELQFSRDSNDGGKADIVETKNETVEGKVYQVSLEAIKYLYHREGVDSFAYRPAIIDVVISGKIKRAITFIGTQKEDETPPTALYAREILRGGKEFLSDTYHTKLQNKINGLLNK
ncbi:gamma-glutamylcyclotransferase [Virgibacillus flavescens]|uniref:gamma-glutamylcyclotransferase n=1 Tax=Virgibacillus flavescens TaxID=1611422 RepID=UPI003D35528D